MSQVSDEDIAEALLGHLASNYPLNNRACLALLGCSTDWRKDLTELLLSNEPIQPKFRKVLADAIGAETRDGTRLDLIGGGENIDRFRAIAAREKWVVIGLWIDQKISENIKRKDAIPLAATHFAASYETCRDALTYTRKCEQYVENERAKPNTSPLLTRDLLRNVYHHFHIEAERQKKGRKKRGNASNER